MPDLASVSMSALSLGVSITTFAWINLRRVDAAACTLVTAEPKQSSAQFQFSIANLGTRPLLLVDVRVPVFITPELKGLVMDVPSVVAGSLPQVIKPGDMCSTTIETKWTLTFLCEGAKNAQRRGAGGSELYFVAKVIVWNPKGKMMLGEKHIATWRNKPTDSSIRYELSEGPFRLRKVAGEPQFRVSSGREETHGKPIALI